MLQVTTSFRDESCSGLVIMWHVGSNELVLGRMGGPKGTYVIRTWRHHTYRNAEGAAAGAERQFKALASTFGAPVQAKETQHNG